MAGSAFCESKCKVRSAKAGVMDRCLRYCEVCCEEWKCVPSGTYGNKDECPCYRDKVTKGKNRKPECPGTGITCCCCYHIYILYGSK
ncbi:hypothetical protein BHM03_00005827 [Ensete ventricosum]|nr:hypothetical protein BHM03_00005827 [Ensete ventricosum]